MRSVLEKGCFKLRWEYLCCDKEFRFVWLPTGYIQLQDSFDCLPRFILVFELFLPTRVCVARLSVCVCVCCMCAILPFVLVWIFGSVRRFSLVSSFNAACLDSRFHFCFIQIFFSRNDAFVFICIGMIKMGDPQNKKKDGISYNLCTEERKATFDTRLVIYALVHSKLNFIFCSNQFS